MVLNVTYPLHVPAKMLAWSISHVDQVYLNPLEDTGRDDRFDGVFILVWRPGVNSWKRKSELLITHVALQAWQPAIMKRTISREIPL